MTTLPATPRERQPTNRAESDGFSVIQHGIHTARIYWTGNCDHELNARRLRFGTVDRETREQLTPRKGVLSHSRSGMRVMMRGEVLVTEFEVGRLLYGDTLALADAADLTRSTSVIEHYAASLGLSLAPPDSAVVRRLDLAVDTRFEDAACAHDHLRAFASLDLSRLTRAVYSASSGRTESIAWRTKRGVAQRVYDQSARAGFSAGGGHVLRIERQRRLLKSDAVALGSVESLDFAQQFGHYLAPFATDHLAAVPVPKVWDTIQGMIGVASLPGRDSQRKLLTHTVGVNLCGTAVALASRGDAAFPDARAAREAKRRLREIGVVPTLDPRDAIPIGRLITASIDVWRAERG